MLERGDTYRLRQFESQWESSSAHLPHLSLPASTPDTPPISSARQLQIPARSHSLSRLPSPRCPTGFLGHRKSCSRQWLRSAYSLEGAPRLCGGRLRTLGKHWPSVEGPLALERGESWVRTLFWTRTRIPTTPSLDGDNTSCSWPAETKGFLSDCFKSKNISFRLSCSS